MKIKEKNIVGQSETMWDNSNDIFYTRVIMLDNPEKQIIIDNSVTYFIILL